MILKKLIESTTGVSNPSWTTQWITFIAGWWKSSRMATRTRLASIPTLHRHGNGKTAAKSVAVMRTCASALRCICALTLAFAMISDLGPVALAQSSKHKKKIKKPTPPPCLSGCRPDTAAPDLVAGDTPEDQALQKELTGLARALHNTLPGAYAN